MGLLDYFVNPAVASVKELFDGGDKETVTTRDVPPATGEETLLQESLLNLFTSPTLRGMKQLCPKLGDMTQYDKNIDGWQCDNLKQYVPDGIVTREQWDAIVEHEKETAPFNIEEAAEKYIEREEDIGGRYESILSDWNDFIDKYGGESGNIYANLQKELKSMPEISMRIPSGEATTMDLPLPTTRLEQSAINRAGGLMNVLGSGAGLQAQGLGNLANTLGGYQRYNIGSLMPVQMQQGVLSDLANLRLAQAGQTTTTPGTSWLRDALGLTGVAMSLSNPAATATKAVDWMLG